MWFQEIHKDKKDSNRMEKIDLEEKTLGIQYASEKQTMPRHILIKEGNELRTESLVGVQKKEAYARDVSNLAKM